MISTAQLKTLQAIGFDLKDKENLVDIKTVSISDSLDPAERTLQYIEAIHNPYLFRVGDTVVRVRYGKGKQTLQESVISFLTHR